MQNQTEELKSQNTNGVYGKKENSSGVKEQYKELVKEITPTASLPKRCMEAFLVGGLICLLGQGILWLMEEWAGVSAEDAAGWCTLILIALSVILTNLGIYRKLVSFGGAGALVPITGFANSVSSAATEFKAEGWVFGVGSKIFSIAGPVILYGILCSWAFGLIYWFIQTFIAG